MNNLSWKKFFTTCRRILGKGEEHPAFSESRFIYTTFKSIRHSIHYWQSGFPETWECMDDRIRTEKGNADLYYSDIAHIVIPHQFEWWLSPGFYGDKFKNLERSYFELNQGTITHGTKFQDLDRLSNKLKELNIEHQKTELILEIKLY